jgi:hypothetical protein
MSGWNIPTCALCGLRFSNRALLGLHVREDHLDRNRPARPDHHESAETGPSRPCAGGPAVDDSPAGSRARTADEVTATAITQPPRSRWLMTALRRAIGTVRYVNDELVRASEAMIRSARAPQAARWPDTPAGSGNQAASAKYGDRVTAADGR